jgi:GNAT superfamily N-acetyltransferase
MTEFKLMTSLHTKEVLEMMREFYSSPAVYTNGSDEIFLSDIKACVGDSPYLEGYVFEETGKVQGYAMLAKSFSTEFGRECIWIEDIYIKPKYRNKGIGTAFFGFVKEKYLGCILRLEVEPENETAMALYKKSGFDILPYTEMKNILN